MILFWWQRGLQEYERNTYKVLIQSLRDYIKSLEQIVFVHEVLAYTVLSSFALASIYLIVDYYKPRIKKYILNLLIKFLKK